MSEWGEVVFAVRGCGQRRHRLARDSSLPSVQLKSQEGEAGRLPQTELLPFNTTPQPGAGRGEVLGWESGGYGKDGGFGVVCEPRMVILLPFGFRYKKHLYF